MINFPLDRHFDSGTALRSTVRVALLSHPRTATGGHGKTHLGAMAGLGDDLGLAADLRDEVFDGAEPHAAALADIPCGEKGVEYRVAHLLGHTDPGIADRDHHQLVSAPANALWLP